MRSSLVNLGFLTCADAAIAASEGKCGALRLSGIPMDLRKPICHVAALQNARRKTQTASKMNICHVDSAQKVNQETFVETSGMADQSDNPIQPSSYVMGVSSNQTDVTETHLHSLHTDLYKGVVDAVLDGKSEKIGKQVILGPAFTGGPRHYRKCYHKAMAIVRATQRPDFFINFTCNPKWPEILRELLPGQIASSQTF